MKRFAVLMCAVILLVMVFSQINIAFAMPYCDFEVKPYPVFGRKAALYAFSRLYNPPNTPFGHIQARLYKSVFYAWYDGNGDLYQAGCSGWLWAKTIDYAAGQEQYWAAFVDDGSLAGLSWGWNPPCQQWDMVRWIVSYRIEWWYRDWLWQPEWTKIAETGAISIGHDEVKGKISNVAWSGCLRGFGNVYNPSGVVGLWPDGNYAAIYGFQSGDLASIIGRTNAYLGSPYMHRIEMYCYTVSGYSPMVYVYASPDYYYGWQLVWSGRITNTIPSYVVIGYPATTFKFVSVVVEVPQGQYGAILYVDCLTIYPYWF